MKSKSVTWKVALATVTLCSTSAFAQKHWGYEGEEGPQNWSKLDPKFVMCALGKNQSPIDISGFSRGRSEATEVRLHRRCIGHR